VVGVALLVLLYIGYFSDSESGGGTFGQQAVANELYTTLENNDTLNLARIELGKNISILDISKIFYNDSIFWPYIAMSNKALNDPLKYNLLYIPKGTVLSIPAIAPVYLDKHNKTSIERVERIRDSIMLAIEEKRKPNEPGW
ncbi:MAG: hypothetical protein LBR34_10585, partial [Prevotella sp.]|nr:hypothetical protein [Prevotella sp.]